MLDDINIKKKKKGVERKELDQREREMRGRERDYAKSMEGCGGVTDTSINLANLARGNSGVVLKRRHNLVHLSNVEKKKCKNNQAPSSKLRTEKQYISL